MLPLPAMPVARPEPSLVFACAHCKGTVAATPAVGGQLVTCPLCGGLMVAPRSSGEPAQAVVEPSPVMVAPPPAGPSVAVDPEPQAADPLSMPTPEPDAAVTGGGSRSKIQVVPRQSLQDRPAAASQAARTPAANPPLAASAKPESPVVRPASGAPRAMPRSLHPETGIDHSHLEQRESLTLLRVVAAFVTVGAICAAVVWALRAHASF